MKYRLLKDIPFHTKWAIFIYDKEKWKAYREWVNKTLGIHWFHDTGFYKLLWEWFEEIKEVKSIYDLEEDDTYYTTSISWYIQKESWTEHSARQETIELWNAFLTKEEAETELQKRKAMATIKKWSWENDWGYEMKWAEMSYYVFLDWFVDKEGAEFNIQETYVWETLWEHYYSTEEKAEQALKELEAEYKILFNIK